MCEYCHQILTLVCLVSIFSALEDLLNVLHQSLSECIVAFDESLLLLMLLLLLLLLLLSYLDVCLLWTGASRQSSKAEDRDSGLSPVNMVMYTSRFAVLE